MTTSKFRTLQEEGAPAHTIELTFDGRALTAMEGCSVAAALLAGGVTQFRRTTVSGSARAPYCMMGVCFDCLVEIDGRPNRQACLVPVRSGMKVCTQQGPRSVIVPDGFADGE